VITTPKGATLASSKVIHKFAPQFSTSSIKEPMSNPNAGPSEEIDLGQLFQKIGSRLREGGMSFVRFLALLRRVPIENQFSFIGIVGFSLVLAISYSILLKKSYYESTMILSSQYLNKRLVDNSIENLDNLAKESSSRGLAKVLDIPDSLAANILGFEATPFISEEEILSLELLKEQLRNSGEEVDEGLVDQVVSRIEIENRHSFEITIRTLTPTVIPNLQHAIVDYFRSNEYVKRRIEIMKTNLEAKKIKLETELKNFDSLKLVIYANYKSMADQSRGGSNNVILSERAVTNPVEVYNRDLDLYDELQEVNRSIYLQQDFEIVDGFTEFSEPASPSTAKVALLSLIFGFVVAYLDVAVRSFNKYLANLK
jgi:hypothetical protein